MPTSNTLAWLRHDGKPLEGIEDPALLDITWGMDFGAPHETALTQLYAKPVFVTGFPTAIKAFYMEPYPGRPEVCNLPKSQKTVRPHFWNAKTDSPPSRSLPMLWADLRVRWRTMWWPTSKKTLCPKALASLGEATSKGRTTVLGHWGACWRFRFC